MNINPIKNKQDYTNALNRIEALWEAQPHTPEGDEFEVLVTLIHVYESEHYPIDAPDPVEAIKFRMEQQGLKDIDLIPMLGQRSRVSEILNRKRKLSITMIRKLNEMLKIPLDSLTKDYDLAK
ncbi:MAG: DNA-binding protein [Paraglaciecola sp.]|nr:DNA-binding protein [Paraglaciecola sp.]